MGNLCGKSREKSTEIPVVEIPLNPVEQLIKDKYGYTGTQEELEYFYREETSIGNEEALVRRTTFIKKIEKKNT